MRLLFALGIVLILTIASFAQTPVSPYRPVEPIDLPFDRGDVWTLHFAYVPPRIVTIETPDKGRRQVWYMVYKVWNLSDSPQTFEPRFELVTKDGELRNFLDETQPTVVKKIREIEDPTGALDIKTSFTISRDRIPMSKKENAVPRAIYGVAVWLDVPEQAEKVNNFSIYVSGLSNGRAVAEKKSGDEEIRLKTLQIDFSKPTENRNPRHDDIRTNENNGLGATKWIYRVIPVAKADKAEK